MSDTTEMQQELLIKEDQLLRVSTRVIYGAAVALVMATLWLSGETWARSQLRLDFDEHMKSNTEYRTLNDRRWLRINNALIRIQARQGIKVPPDELDEPLDE